MKREKEEYSRGKEIFKFIIIVFIFFIIISLVYWIFLYTKTCESKACFLQNQEKCKRVRWINDDDTATWLYTIKAQKRQGCEVFVKLLQIKEGKIDLKELEGKEMSCYAGREINELPGKDLENCTGELKEEIQEEIIKKTHSYILGNLEKINKAL